MNIAVIGLGNRWRGDDTFGLKVISFLKGKRLLKHRVKLFAWEGDCLNIASLWQGCQAVILIDALYLPQKAGKIYHWDLTSFASSEEFLLSTHGLNLIKVIELYRQLNKLPQVVIFYGVAGKNFKINNQMSQEVKKAIKVITELVTKKICSLLTM